MWTDGEIEKLYKRYYYNKSVLELSEPSITSQLRMDNVSGQSRTELAAIRQAQADIEIKMVNACLNAMNRDERDFVSLRYFEDIDIKIAAGCMRYGRDKLYDIRRKVLDKSKDLLTITIT
jgi:hypothetical protein